MDLVLLALFAAVTGRWWVATLRALLDDVRAAAEPQDVPERALEPHVHVRGAVEVRAPGPLQRRLAFRGLARRVARRRRWEGGFGRRGL